jgi:hypothetical protein
MAVLGLLLRKVNFIMANEQDLEAHLQVIADKIVEIAKEISDLKTGGVQLVTQEQLDSLDAKAQAIAAAIDAAK